MPATPSVEDHVRRWLTATFSDCDRLAGKVEWKTMGKGIGCTSTRRGLALAGSSGKASSKAQRPDKPRVKRGTGLLPLERLNQLLSNRPPEHPKQLPAPEVFRKAHRFQHNGLRIGERPAEHQHEHELSPYWFQAQILDEHGNEAGYVQRHLGLDQGRLVVSEGIIRLYPDYQGKGFGGAFAGHCEQAYRRLGVDRIEIVAMEVGAYTWAQRGYFFDPRRADTYHHRPEADAAELSVRVASKLWEEFWWRVDDLVADKHITRKQAAAFKRRFATPLELERGRFHTKFATPYEIAQYGRNRPFVDRDGNTTWLGKHFLTGLISEHDHKRGGGLTWPGVKFL